MTTATETRERLLRQGRVAFAAKGHDGVSLPLTRRRKQVTSFLARDTSQVGAS